MIWALGGAATKVITKGTFGGLSIHKPGVGKSWWNAGSLRKGSDAIAEPLDRDGLAGPIGVRNCALGDDHKIPITMNSLAVQAGVAATTLTRLVATDDKTASALSLDLASRIVTVLDCGIEDLLEVVEQAS